MPHIVRCIDDYFTEKKRDLYFIKFKAPRSRRHASLENPPGRRELMAWLAEALPQVEVAPLFTHSWNSGIISVEYDGTISVDFDDDSLAIFTARWEDEEGKSIDPRFQCYFKSLASFLEAHGGQYPSPPNMDDIWPD